MRTSESLFTVDNLSSALDARQREASKAVEEWEPDKLLATAEADVVEYLIGEYSVACPVLHRDRAQQLPISEEVAQLQGFWSDEAYERRLTKIVIAVPFDGEPDVFKYRASTLTANPPKGEVHVSELRVAWTGEGNAVDAAAMRQHLDGELDKIEQYLSWSGGDIERYNTGLRTSITSWVAQRRAKLLADRDLEAVIGFPVRQRPDAAKYAVPVVRRKIAVAQRPVAHGPFQPEPFLPDAQYEQALEVLRNARNALERTPSMTTNLNEEKIRDLLLVFLNAQFEGAAAGEVFNGAG
ncbi:MAG TPA: hypothetical protein VGJ54_06420, partial [Streptosporangiaceae bacterium]